MADTTPRGARVQITSQILDNAEVLPEAPTEAIGRYVVLLRQWEDLTRKQAAYDKELRTLQATGDKLAAQWEDLAEPRRACQEELHGLALPLDSVIERCWDTMKAQLWALCLTANRSLGMGKTPMAIELFADPQPRNPRGAA